MAEHETLRHERGDRHGGGDGADPQGCAEPVAHLVQVCSQAIALGQDSVSPPDHQLAFGGKPAELPAALDDRHVEFALQLPDSGRQGWLAHETLAGGAAEVVLAGQRSKVLQLTNQHFTAHQADTLRRDNPQLSAAQALASLVACPGTGWMAKLKLSSHPARLPGAL